MSHFSCIILPNNQVKQYFVLVAEDEIIKQPVQSHTAYGEWDNKGLNSSRSNLEISAQVGLTWTPPAHWAVVRRKSLAALRCNAVVYQVVRVCFPICLTTTNTNHLPPVPSKLA